MANEIIDVGNMDMVETGMFINTRILSDKELDLQSNQITNEKIRRYGLELAEMKNNMKKIDEKFNEHEKALEEQRGRLDAQEKLTNVIGFGAHSHKYKTFRKVCGARVYEILGSTATVEFILWSHYFFKRIHGDIAAHFQVDTCKNVNVDDYEQAKALASLWRPEDWYIKEKLEDLKNKRDMGMLKPERCMALTVYLQNTNNGEFNPF